MELSLAGLKSGKSFNWASYSETQALNALVVSFTFSFALTGFLSPRGFLTEVEDEVEVEEEELFFANGKSLALPSVSHRALAPFLPALTRSFLFVTCFFLSFSKRGWIYFSGSFG